MNKIIFVANNNVGQGFSGGDRIFTEFIKGWYNKLEIVLMGSEEAIRISKERGIDEEMVTFVETDSCNKDPNYFSVAGLLEHTARRLFRGLKAVCRNKTVWKDADYVYSVSDFYPDLLPALYIKLRSSRVKWLAGYYLFAPFPFLKESPYKGKSRLKGLFYWLMQRPSFALVKFFADKVLVTSQPDVNKFLGGRFSEKDIVVVQGGVDIGPSEKYLRSGEVIPVEDRKYDACFLGRLHPQKGVLELLDIWKIVCKKSPDRQLLIIGDGELEQAVRGKIRSLGLGDNIHMAGFADGREKFELFKQSKIMVHPAVYDSGGMAAAEGMAWGLPGVSFDLEALKTYYPQGMMKVPVGDTGTFADAVYTLLKDEKMYNKKREEALELIRTVWDWDRRRELIYNQVFADEK